VWPCGGDYEKLGIGQISPFVEVGAKLRNNSRKIRRVGHRIKKKVFE